MQTENAAAPPMADAGGSISLDQFAAELGAEPDAPEVEEEDEQPESVEGPVQGVEQPEAADPDQEEELDLSEDEDEPEDESKPKTHARVAEPPQSWSKEDQAVWDQLPPAAQLVVSKREADRDKAVALSRQEVTQQNKLLQTFSARLDEIAPHAMSVHEQRWANVDWEAVARADEENGTQNFNLYKARYEKETAEVERIQREQQAASKVARERFIQEEAARLATEAPELVDPVKGPERREKTGKFLLGLGIPPEALANISAVELGLAHDAMRYREAKQKMAAKASEPKKETPRQAPKAISPVSGASVSPQRQLQGLEQNLTKRGGINDLVALFDAEDAIKAKKARRQ